MTDAERFVKITSLLNEAGTLATATDDPELVGLIGDAVVVAWKRARSRAELEGREIVAA